MVVYRDLLLKTKIRTFSEKTKEECSKHKKEFIEKYIVKNIGDNYGNC